MTKLKKDDLMSTLNIDLNALMQIMFQDSHFINCKHIIFTSNVIIVLTNQLGKKPAANKLEKFIAEKAELKIREL